MNHLLFQVFTRPPDRKSDRRQEVTQRPQWQTGGLPSGKQRTKPRDTRLFLRESHISSVFWFSECTGRYFILFLFGILSKTQKETEWVWIAASWGLIANSLIQCSYIVHVIPNIFLATLVLSNVYIQLIICLVLTEYQPNPGINLFGPKIIFNFVST